MASDFGEGPTVRRAQAGRIKVTALMPTQPRVTLWGRR